MSNSTQAHDSTQVQHSTQAQQAGAKDSERNRKPKLRRFHWLFEEWVFQALLVIAVFVALIDGFASVNHIPIA